jgi:hypothetical protein
VSDSSDDPVDLTSLHDDVTRRAARVTARVVARMAAARRAQTRRSELVSGVRRRLARLAIPLMLAAAASLAAVLATGNTRPRPEPFAVAVLGRGPVTRWVALDRRPGIPEVVVMAGSLR